jgi:ribose transport system ATP-binding protein
MMVGRDLELTMLTDPHVGSEEALRVENLVRHGAIGPISFVAHKGEIISLAGLVGAGRTSLARAIFGADPLDSGEIYVDGHRVRIQKPEDAVRAGIGFLTEDRLISGLAMSLSVAHNITLPSLSKFERLLVLNLRSEREAASTMVQQFSIATPSPDQIVRYLSGGNQQKVVLAKWLMANSRILFLDEPTQGIDVGAKEEVHRLMVDFARKLGGTVIMISSDLPEVLRLSDRILVMRDGKIAAELPGTVATQEQVMNYALGVTEEEALQADDVLGQRPVSAINPWPHDEDNQI